MMTMTRPLMVITEVSFWRSFSKFPGSSTVLMSDAVRPKKVPEPVANTWREITPGGVQLTS